MGAEQIAIIRPVIEELQAANTKGTSNLCVTFFADGQDAFWIQFMEGMANLAYPFDEEPLEFFARKEVFIPPSFSMTCFESGLYATFNHDVIDPDVLSRFTDQVLTAVHGVDSESYKLSVQREHL